MSEMIGKQFDARMKCLRNKLIHSVTDMGLVGGKVNSN